MIARACAHTRHVPGANLNGDAVRRTASWVAWSKCPPIGPCLNYGESVRAVQAGTGRDVAVDRQVACSAFLGLAGRTIHLDTTAGAFSQWSQPIHLDNPVPRIAGRLQAVVERLSQKRG